MKKNINPMVAALVIVLAIAVIAFKYWADGKTKAYTGPAHLRVAPNGHLFVQINNQLIEHDRDGVFLQRHDLNQIGVTTFVGDFDFFEDGSVLLRRGPYNPSFSDNVRAFRRQQNSHDLSVIEPETGLYRCDLESRVCQVFGKEPIDFKGPFSIHIDSLTDTVYFSDTTRHLIRKFSFDGEELAEAGGGFLFPNHIALVEGQLYVADTNRHSVTQVNRGDENFGRFITQKRTDSDAPRAIGEVWTRHFLKVGDGWWVNNMKNNMIDGGIHVFDKNWRHKTRLALPNDADPITMVTFGNRVLISDWKNNRLYSADPNNLRIEEFASPGLDSVIHEYATETRYYRHFSYAAIGLFGLILASLIGAAMIGARNDYV